MSLRLEDHVLRVLEAQTKLHDTVGEHNWGFDMDAGALQFTARRGAPLLATCPVQLIGTESEHERTWPWARVNAESEIPAGLVRAPRECAKQASAPPMAFDSLGRVADMDSRISKPVPAGGSSPAASRPWWKVWS